MLVDINDKSIDEQGERMVPAFHKGALVYGEHLIRYEAALALLKDKVVLDISSGSGYGTYILAGKAREVYGVDIDRQAVAYAKRNYQRPNIKFMEGSAEAIPLDNQSVDAVVSFETIEHLKNYKKFLSEIKRVLKPEGLLLISTPNDEEFPQINQFHLHEFTLRELKDLLGQYFKNVQFSFQYTWLMVGLMEEKAAKSEGELDLKVTSYAGVPKEKAIYFMAVCSDGPIKDQKIKSLGAISEHWNPKGQKEDLYNLHREVKRINNLLEGKGQIEKQLVSQLKTASAELHQIHSSRGWRLLLTARTIKSRLRRVFRRK